MTLSYLTTGLSWKADYVALFDEKQSALSCKDGSRSPTIRAPTYKDAKTPAVAGDINYYGP